MTRKSSRNQFLGKLIRSIINLRETKKKEFFSDHFVAGLWGDWKSCKNHCERVCLNFIFHQKLSKCTIAIKKIADWPKNGQKGDFIVGGKLMQVISGTKKNSTSARKNSIPDISRSRMPNNLIDKFINPTITTTWLPLKKIGTPKMSSHLLIFLKFCSLDSSSRFLHLIRVYWPLSAVTKPKYFNFLTESMFPVSG